MKNYNTYLLTVFLGFVVLTIGIASFAYYKFDALQERVGNVKHTTMVIDQAEYSLYVLREVESDQRGYLLTNDPDFLPTFYNAQHNVRKAFETLRSLTDDNALQQERLAKLDKLVDRRMRVMQQSLFARQINPAAPVTDSLKLGKQLMDSIRAGFDVVIAEERKLMAQRESQQTEAISNVPTLTLLLSGVALVILVLSYLATRRQHVKELLYRDELRRNNLRLSQQNKELEQFAYITSHDLQEPMRKIQTLSDRILYKHGNNLDRDVLDSLERIRHSSARMRLLVDDVLQYSRIQHRESNNLVDVNLSDALRDALQLLDETIKHKNAVIAASPLPVIRGVYSQWVQVFLNLVGNALKFAKENTPPQISITVERVDRGEKNDDHSPKLFHKITLKDNGIGFEERYAEKIFQVFQRLHASDRYPGTGIGLALVNKVVQLHHGAVEAHSVPEEGTTIVIHLPVSVDSQQRNHPVKTNAAEKTLNTNEAERNVEQNVKL